MAAKPHPNWSQAGPLLPLDTLADSFTGPVVLADETQTVRWFLPHANKNAIEHSEHVRGSDEEGFLHDADGEPIMKTSTVKPAFWTLAVVL